MSLERVSLLDPRLFPISARCYPKCVYMVENRLESGSLGWKDVGSGVAVNSLNSVSSFTVSLVEVNDMRRYPIPMRWYSFLPSPNGL